ncbi:GspH/FimT family pseudopilin [Paucidesulfovibrio longus]|uniref:GspH/FimT family pseudopilin n=1 Tax=Paucidesulfovibrio longus TaxID=889 RepID=UPI0003B5036D|nr:GspH/FimT family pseudopilin [Paucidesulfovibrio longus]
MRAALRPSGFTIIELVVVLIVLAIVSAVIVSRVSSLDIRAAGQADALRSHLLHAQSRALKSGSPWGLSCSGTEYWMFTGTNPNDATKERPLPGEEAMHVVLANKGVGITAFTVIYDAYGRPETAGGVLLNANLDITVQSAGNAGSTASLSVIPETGYVQ